MLARQGWQEERVVTPREMSLVIPQGLTLRLANTKLVFPLGTFPVPRKESDTVRVERAQRADLTCSILQMRKPRPQEKTLHGCCRLSIVSMPTVCSKKWGPVSGAASPRPVLAMQSACMERLLYTSPFQACRIIITHIPTPVQDRKRRLPQVKKPAFGPAGGRAGI